ncbi:aminoglycoside phosphotransferase family protein [Glaciibacter sp. 2TAF33]|uniref:aminoglycoside phosphotransferase family protein n=1 Tax=Glaciibacter sp. 2TAF33 TaxID=3233015 RepID=UPI003F8ED800
MSIGESLTGHPEVAAYCARWALEPDGVPFTTASSVLAPVRSGGRPAMLKIATAEEEQVGNGLMTWWSGAGAAAPVLRHDDTTVLLERATGGRSLESMADTGRDDEATRILCATAMRLHAVGAERRTDPPAALPRLDDWFGELFQHAAEAGDSAGGFYARAAALARTLLDGQGAVGVLHGDLHHGNVLDFGGAPGPAAGEGSGGAPGGPGSGDRWLAIDPKGLIGDRAFDFANILCNPTGELATRPGRLERQLAVITEAAGLGRERMLGWCVAWCGLSAAWYERSGMQPSHTLEVGAEAERLLGRARRG